MCNKNHNRGKWLAVLLMLLAFSAGAAYETDVVENGRKG